MFEAPENPRVIKLPMTHPALNLPPLNLQLIEEDGKTWAFDPCRKKQVLLLPEEWVRQHFIRYLLEYMRYPAALIKVEGGLSVNSLQKRTDILVYSRTGKPWLLVECKTYTQKLDEQTLRQAAMYNSSLEVDYLVLSNGMAHHCFHIDRKAKKLHTLKQLPVFPE